MVMSFTFFGNNIHYRKFLFFNLYKNDFIILSRNYLPKKDSPPVASFVFSNKLVLTMIKTIVR